MGFWLLVIAVAAFYFLSKGYAKSHGKAKGGDTSSCLIIALVAKVAKSDGVVSVNEADLIGEILTDFSNKFGVSRDILKSVYEREKSRLDNARSIAMEYRFSTGATKEQSCSVLIFLLNLAYVDGVFSPAERKILIEIAYGLGIDDSLRANIFAKFESEFNTRFGSNKLDAYEVLGLSKDASFEDVKKRYKELVRKNHPDLLMGQGADDFVVSEATKKLQEINEAYEIIKKQQGRS